MNWNEPWHWLTLLIVVMIGSGGLAWWRSNYTLPQAILYSINTLVTTLLWRAKVSGRLELGPREGAVIVCNHSSGVDPLVIQRATNRQVHWMVAKEYCNNPWIAWGFRILGAIPVNRGGVDTAATKQAIRLAQSGEIVGVFPEGRINTTSDVLLPGRPGAALIALRARVRVVPCWISGVPYTGTAYSSFLHFGHARLVVGQPLDLGEFAGREKDDGVLQEVTLRFMREIARLGQHAEFEPQLAGRRWRSGEEESVAE